MRSRLLAGAAAANDVRDSAAAEEILKKLRRFMYVAYSSLGAHRYDVSGSLAEGDTISR